MIMKESRVYRLTGMSPILGSQPADPEIRKTYVEDKIRQAGDRQDRADEAENLDPTQEQIDKKSTIFGCRAEDGALILWDYQIRERSKPRSKCSRSSWASCRGILSLRSSCTSTRATCR